MAFGILHYLDHSVESCVAGSFFIDWCISKATSVLRGGDTVLMLIDIIASNVQIIAALAEHVIC